MSMALTTTFDAGPLLFHITNSQRDGQEIMAADEKCTFAVVLQPDEEGGFTVRVPLLPEIVTFGRDEREALAMAEDAIRLVIEDRTARGELVERTSK
jgi:antitoxin HicB